MAAPAEDCPPPPKKPRIGREVQQTGQRSDRACPPPVDVPPVSAHDSPATYHTRQQVTQDESSQRRTSSYTPPISAQRPSTLGNSMASGNATPSSSHGQQVSGPSAMPTVPVTQSPSSLPLWDRTNPEQQGIVALSARYKDLLNDKLNDLTGIVQLEDMWAALKSLHVLDQREKDRIVKHDAIPADSIERLVHYLETGPTWKLHAFLRALVKNDQAYIIQHLGLEPADYMDSPTPCHSRPASKSRKPHYYKRIESKECIQISNDLLPGLLQHCGSYNKTLMKASLFGYKKNIPIDLTRIYVCQDASCKQNLREKIPVGKKELFQRLFGTRCPSCLSMEGPAGTGKSSYLEKYAHDWSRDITSCEHRGPDVPCKGHLWKLIVYIAGGGIRGTAADAIRDNLRCEPHIKDQMVHPIEKDGEGVLIMYDAMDELRHQESIDSISSYVETAQKMMGKPKVLVSARDGLLSVERRFFDRELHLEGFSLPQGISYMKHYFDEMHSLNDHPVLQHIETHSKDLQWVLSNPIRVHILSELTACGFLTLQDVQTLTTVKLFRNLDNLLVMRDKECRPSPSSQPPNFYQACLRCLLTDTRTISEGDIGVDSPYLSLLQRHNYMDQDFQECCNFTFPHEVLFEYFSMRGIIECLKNSVEYKQGLLLWLCSNKKMRNVLQLTCGYIAQYEHQLLPGVVFIIRACLIVQTQHGWCEQNELTQELLQLPDVILESFPPNVLTHGLTAEQATKLGGISNKIHSMFNENTDLKEAGWFMNSYGIYRGCVNPKMSPFHKFLLGCLQQLTHQQLEDVFSQTFNQLLPCTRHNVPSVYRPRSTSDFNLVPVGGVRWAAVEISALQVDITVWSACDLLSVLNTCSHLPRTQQLRFRYSVYIDSPAHTLFTSLPADPWSEEQWTPGLGELMSPRYCAGEIIVYMDYSTLQLPLGGLLSACRQVIQSGHGLTRGLGIVYGQVAEDDLILFCTWAGEVGLRLSLQFLTVVMRAGHGEKDWRDVDSAIRRMVEVEVGHEKGELDVPTYMTSEGEVLCKEYKPDV